MDLNQEIYSKSHSPRIIINKIITKPEHSSPLKPSNTHIKRFSASYLPISPLSPHKQRKNTLEHIIEEAKSSRKSPLSSNPSFLLLKPHPKSNENPPISEETLLINSYFLQTGPDFIIERTKIYKNWLLNLTESEYDQFLQNAFYLNQIRFEEFKARNLPSTNSLFSDLTQEIQKIILKRKCPIPSSLISFKITPFIQRVPDSYSNLTEGLLLQKTGDKLNFSAFRRVFFTIKGRESIPEWEKRYSFLQKEKQGYKEYPLPIEVLLEYKGKSYKSNKKSSFLQKAPDWTASKVKDYGFRVIIHSIKKPIGIYLKNEKEALEVYYYLIFKKFIKGFPKYVKFFKDLSLILHIKSSSTIVKLLSSFIEAKTRLKIAPKQLDSGLISIESFYNIEDNLDYKEKDHKIVKKTQKLIFIMKSFQNDIFKGFIDEWLKKALIYDETSKKTIRNGVLPKEILYFQTRKQRLKAIEAWQKDFGVISFERLLIRRFIVNWLEKASFLYKNRLKRSTSTDDKASFKLSFYLETIEIPSKFDYFKPKIQITLSRVDIDKPRYILIEGSHVLIDKRNYFQRVFEGVLIERKSPGLLCYEFPLEASFDLEGDFELGAYDRVIIELFDDASLSIFEGFKKKKAIDLDILTNNLIDKSEKIDISLFLASSRLITHRMELRLKDLSIRKEDFLKEYWIPLELFNSDIKEDNEEFRLPVFIKLASIKQKKPLGEINNFYDSVFNVNLLDCKLFDPKTLKKLDLWGILSRKLPELAFIGVKHEENLEIQLKKLFFLIAQRNNEFLCKNYVQSLYKPLTNRPNSFSTRSSFLNYYGSNLNNPKSFYTKGLTASLRRALWGFPFREELFTEAVAKYMDFRSEYSIVKPLPAPLIEQTLYSFIFLDEEIPLNYDKSNYLAFLQDIRLEGHSFSIKKSFIKEDLHEGKVFNLLKGLYIWGFITENRFLFSEGLLSLIIAVISVLEAGNYPYYSDIGLSKGISPLESLESDIFWCLLSIIARYYKGYFLLEAPKNAFNSSNHYCNSDLRGFKGDLLLLRLFFKERSLIIPHFDQLIAPFLLDLGSGLFKLRRDLWAMFLDRILLEKPLENPNFGLLALISTGFSYGLRGYETKKIRSLKEIFTLVSLGIALCEDGGEFLLMVDRTTKEIEEFKRKKIKGVFEGIETEIQGLFFFENQFNKVLFSFIEQTKPFIRVNSDFKLSLSDINTLLQLENLFKEEELEKDSQIPCLYVYIQDLTLFLANSFEGDLLLEIIYEEVNVGEIPIQAINTSKIEINEGFCFGANTKSDFIKLLIHQISNKNDKKLIKSCKIGLKGLLKGFIYKNVYKLIDQSPDNNFLSAEITIALLFIHNNNENITFPLIKPPKIPSFISKVYFQEDENLDKTRILIKKTNFFLLNKRAENLKETLDENLLAKGSFSCETSLIKSHLLDFLDFQQVFKRLLPNNPDFQVAISKLFENLTLLTEKIDFCDVFIGLIIMLPGFLELKFEVLYRLLVVLNKGDIEIPSSLFKGFIKKCYRFLGFFVPFAEIEDFIDNGLYNSDFDCFGVEKARIRVKPGVKQFDITDILNDFIGKKQEITNSKDFILGSAGDLYGLKEVLLFYIVQDKEKFLYLLPLLDLRDLKESIFELEIKYKDNQGLYHGFLVLFDENWLVINAIEDKKRSFNKINDYFFYNHRNVITLSALSTIIMTKTKIFEIFSILPSFKYLLSLQNLHKIFEKIPDNPVFDFQATPLYIKVNLEQGISFKIKIEIEIDGILYEKKQKLSSLKVRKFALLLDNSNDNKLKNSLKLPLNSTLELEIKKISCFLPLKMIIMKILVKIMKTLLTLPLKNTMEFINIVPLLNLTENPLNNPLDLNLSFFSIFSLNKRLKSFNFEVIFLHNSHKSITEGVSFDNNESISALGLYFHSNQREQWLPVKLLHSFLNKAWAFNKVPGNFNWNDKNNYEYFTIMFQRFPGEVFIKKPRELILFKMHDLRNMLVPNEIKEFLPILKKRKRILSDILQ